MKTEKLSKIATSLFALLVFAVSQPAFAAAPAATTQAANSITTSSATLNSYVNPNGLNTTIYFQYGLTASYGSTTSLGGIGTVVGNYGFSISGLAANTLYHFRIVAYSSGGTTYGGDLTFTTSGQAPTATTQAASSITSTSAQLNSYVNPNGVSTTIYYQYGLTASYGSTTISGNIGTSAGNYGTTVSSLSPNTTYHFRIVAYSSGGTTYGSDLTFTTSPQPPTATTQAASSITSSSAQLNSYVNPNGASTTIYYQYGLTTSYGSTTISGNIGTSAGNYGTTASSLSANTTYHFRIVAYNSGGTTYGSDLTFTTGVQPPTATTQAATSVATTSATLNGYINPNGASTTAYFEYGLTTSYGSTTTQGNFGTSPQNISYGISSLTPNTLYHFRIVAYNSGGTTYGSDLTFTTPGQQAPTATTQAATSVATTSATLNGYINPNGASTTAYFQYGLTTSYGTTTTSGNFGTSPQNIGYAISSLAPNTTYHFRIVAYNSGGTTYGSDLTFTTLTQGPTAQTLAATAVTTTSAQLNGSINPNGFSTTAYFEYGLTAGYGSTTPSGNFGTAVQNIGFAQTGLSPNSTYHYRIVASNSQGTSRGTDTTFTTAGSGVPTAQTLAAAAVTTTSAQLNGSINPSGFATTAYFEYGLTTSYGSITPSGNFGTAVQNIGFVQTGLSPNTTYHYRIVASNSQGTTRGLDASFATLPTTTTATTAWVAGTSGLGLRLRSTPSLSASVLVVMPEGSSVTLLGDTQTAEGYLWRHLTYASQTGWAAAQYLSFTPGTTPTPPSAPVTLRQLQADGFSIIAAGGSVSAPSVVLAATPSGPSSQEFTIQFELRPSGTAFSSPTTTTAPVQGGSEARATVGALANQGYHWRARTLDGTGVPSEWVSFSANATDFTVSATTSPLAAFTWTPAQVFTGDPITFTAQAVGQAGLTFAWSFGGTPATGATVAHTFALSGDVVVTLTVTDSQSNQSQQSRTVSVISKDLASRITAAAGQSESMLDSVLADATQAADAADYFKAGVDSAPGDIALTAALTGLSLILNSGDDTGLAERCVAWARQAYGNAAANQLAARLATHFVADEIRSEFVSTVAQWAKDALAGGSTQAYRQMWIPGLTTLVNQKKAEIDQLRQQAITAAGSLTPAQSEALVRNLQARLLGNYALQASYATNANLPITFQDYKSSDESGWSTYNIGQHLFSVSAGLLGTALGGMGGIAAGFAAQATTAELDIFNTLAGQSADAQLMSLSAGMAAQGATFASQISTNIEAGLKAVINSQTPYTPAGTLASISPFCRGTLRTYNLLPRWFATEAYADIVVQNTGQQTATYRVEAFLTKTFTTGQLPIHFLGIGERQYKIQTAVAKDGISLPTGGQSTVRLTFLAGDGGLVPEGQDITYTLTARTPDGTYRQDAQTQRFGTTYLDENGNTVDPSVIASASVGQSPLQSTLLVFPGSNTCQLNITVQNPLEVPVMLTIGQNIPSGTALIDAGGATVANNHLSWESALDPGQVQVFQVILQLPLPAANPPLTNTTASAYDSVNATWLQFSQAPVLSRMSASPPPQIQPAGFSAGTFRLGVQALIPGIYRVQATTNFTQWDTLVTSTNAAGSFQVADPAAQSHPRRFYRALRQ